MGEDLVTNSNLMLQKKYWKPIYQLLEIDISFTGNGHLNYWKPTFQLLETNILIIGNLYSYKIYDGLH
jgi:hypothetical protein